MTKAEAKKKMKAIMGRPRIYKDTDEDRALFISRAEDYFKKAKGKPTMSGLALAVGFRRRNTLVEYAKHKDISDIIEHYRLKVEEAYERDLRSPYASGVKFALINGLGWREKTEIDTNIGTKDGEEFKVNITIDGDD